MPQQSKRPKPPSARLPYGPLSILPNIVPTGPPIIPTLEQQELYDHVRDLQEEVKFSEQLQLRDAGSRDDHLRPPSPSATSMSRSTSRTSSQSLTRGIQNVGLSGAQGADDGRRRARRHGPLDRISKARTAFVRKLGACENCRKRRVKCSHMNLSLFEDAYQAGRRSRAAADARAATSGRVPPDSSTQRPSLASATPAGRVSSQDLLGIGPGDTTYPPEQVGNGNDDDLTLEPAHSPSILGRQGLLPAMQGTQNPDVSSLFPVGNSNFSAPSYPAQNAYTGPYTPIGRLVSDLSVAWECQYNNYGACTSLSSGSNDACLERFGRLDELKAHYSVYHSRFREAIPPFLYKCLDCEFLNFDTSSTCFHCDKAGTTWETWYYGHVTDNTSRTTTSGLRIPNQDSSPYATFSDQASSYNGTTAPSANDYAAYDWSSYGDGSNGRSRGWGWGWRLSNDRESCAMAARPHHEKSTGVVSRILPSWKRWRDGRQLSYHVYLSNISVALLVGLFPFVLAFLLLSAAFADYRPAYECLRSGFRKLSSNLFGAVLAHMTETSVAFILAGSVATWLFKHIRFRLNESRSSTSRGGQLGFSDWLGVSDSVDSPDNGWEPFGDGVYR